MTEGTPTPETNKIRPTITIHFEEVNGAVYTLFADDMVTGTQLQIAADRLQREADLLLNMMVISQAQERARQAAMRKIQTPGGGGHGSRRH